MNAQMANVLTKWFGFKRFVRLFNLVASKINMYSAVITLTAQPQHRICLHRTPQNSLRPCRTVCITNMLQANEVIDVLQNGSLAATWGYVWLGEHCLFDLFPTCLWMLCIDGVCDSNWSRNGLWLDRRGEGQSQQQIHTKSVADKIVCVQCMLSQFKNNKVYISTKWLLHLINGQGLKVIYLLQITHLRTSTTHYLAVLPDNWYVCNCCMGMNLGIPCCHYPQALTIVLHSNGTSSLGGIRILI